MDLDTFPTNWYNLLQIQIRKSYKFSNINMCKWMSIHKYGRNKHWKNFLSQQIKEKTWIYLAEIFPNLHVYFYFSTNIVPEISFNLFIKSIQNKNKDVLSVCLLYWYIPWSSSQDVIFVFCHGIWRHPVKFQSSDRDYLVLGQVKELPKQNQTNKC